MLRQPEKPLVVDVTELKRRSPHQRKRQHSKLKSWLCVLFGLAVAVSWHFIHQAGEYYQPTFSDPQFWYHLGVEGVIACYGALLSFIIWTLWERFSR